MLLVRESVLRESGLVATGGADVAIGDCGGVEMWQPSAGMRLVAATPALEVGGEAEWGSGCVLHMCAPRGRERERVRERERGSREGGARERESSRTE